MSCYIRVEAVNLDNLIGDTQTLHVIRGGSALITNAIDEVAAKFGGQMRPIFSDASSGVFEASGAAMDASTAESLCEDVRGHLRSGIFRHATFVVAFALEDITSDHSFGAVCEELLAKNRWQQMQQPSLSLSCVFGAGVAAARLFCELDAIRPATEKYRSSSGSKDICAVCHDRITLGKDTKENFYEKELGPGVTLKSGFAQSFEDISKVEPAALAAKGVSPRLADKIAVIYIDGNGIGKLMRGLDDTGKVVEASKDYKNYRRQFLNELVLGRVETDRDGLWTGGKANDKYNRIELLMWGGDEMTLVVPAWKGWETLSLFYQLSKDWQLNGQLLSHAAGMVFCSHKSHIHHQVNLAHRLAGEVKACASPGNRFACQVLNGFDYVDADLDAARRPLCGESGESLLLSGLAMQGVTEGLAALREAVSRVQVYDLVEELATDSTAAASEKADKLMAALTAQVPNHAEITDCLGKGRTFWLHLRELWNFIPVDSSLAAGMPAGKGGAQ